MKPITKREIEYWRTSKKLTPFSKKRRFATALNVALKRIAQLEVFIKQHGIEVPHE